jgi:hypothetical protein
MGVRSWLAAYWAAWSQGSPGSPDEPDEPESLDEPDAPGHRGTLVDRYRKVNPKIERIKEAAARDVGRIEEDDKFFGPNAPVDQDDIL